MSTRDARLDYLRVAAIAFILLHHADDYAVQFLRATPSLALADDILTWAALAVMFTLSGFLTLKSSSDESASGWEHIRRRFTRLYLPFAIALVLIKLFDAFPLEWDAVRINLALLGPWVGPDVGTLWFVEILLYYQVVYALWLAAPRLRTRAWTVPVLFGVITLGVAAIGRLAGLTLDPRLAVYLPAFAGGASFGAALRYRDNRSVWQQSATAAAFSTVVVGVIVALAPLWTDLPWMGLGVSIATALAVGTILSLRSSTVHPPSLARRLAYPIAYGSFMAYLIHRVVFSSAARVATPLGAVWVSVVVVACIPLVLCLGIPLQRAFDLVVARRLLS